MKRDEILARIKRLSDEDQQRLYHRLVEPAEKGVPTHLAGFVVAEKGPSLKPGELQERLRRQLPEYMIPAQIFIVDSLPVSPNGKLDRRKLQQMTRQPATQPNAKHAPHTALEQVLCRLWSDVLETPVTETSAHFFALGGHSLRVTAMIAKLQDLLDVSVPLRIVFEKPVLADFATWLSAKHPQAEETAALVLEVLRS